MELLRKQIIKEAGKPVKKNSLIQRLIQGQEIKIGKIRIYGFYFSK